MQTLRGQIDLLVFDFDGVLTDNRVIVAEDGTESVVCNRADGLAFDMLRAAGLPVLILSTERNRVVAARAAKLKAPVLQAVGDKAHTLVEHCRQGGIDLRRVAFVGNDLNDVAVMRVVGFPIAVADSHPNARAAASLVLATRGGDGVARELAEKLLALPYGEAMSATAPAQPITFNERGEGVLALVPARGGSKSVPRKNLRVVAGKPLIAHSVDHARKSSTVTRVIVTTDDQEIAEVGRAAGAEVPFMRPAEFAQDLSTDYEFVRHALEWLRENEGYVPELVVQLRPTTPVRDVRLIDRAVEAIRAKPEADSLRAVVGACFTPYKMWHLGADGFLVPLLALDGMAECYNQPRQILPDVYQQDGFLDIVRPRTVFAGSITGQKILPLFIDRESIDIDYEHEFAEAEQQLQGD
jgi:N-acylneuraminate cytidylyltransferase